jgi:hypothetical protein
MLQSVIEFEMIRPAGDAADTVSPRFGSEASRLWNAAWTLAEFAGDPG